MSRAAALQNAPADVNALVAITHGAATLDEQRRALIAKIGENISVRRFARVTSPGPLGAYIHGGRIGALVALQGGDEALARDLAMHVTAANPAYIDASGVPAAVLDKEREILAEQTKAEKKPPEIIAKMVEGRLRKYLAEITLLGQPFVKDPDTTVEKLLKKAGADGGAVRALRRGRGHRKETGRFRRRSDGSGKGAGEAQGRRRRRGRRPQALARNHLNSKTPRPRGLL